MNRKMQRELERQQRRKPQKPTVLETIQKEIRTNKIFSALDTIYEREKQEMYERHSLDENGHATIEFDTEMDSVGGLGLLDTGDFILPIATVSADTKEQLSIVLKHFTQQWEELGVQKLDWMPNVWDGIGMKLVLSQRIGDLWDMYLGQEKKIDHVEMGLLTSLHTQGGLNAWNEWQIRFEDPSMVPSWHDHVKKLGMCLFFACEPRDASKRVDGYEMMIPAENVTVRPLSK